MLVWATLAAALAAAAYLVGAALAQRLTELPSPPPSATPTLPAQAPTRLAVAWLVPGDPMEGTLGEGSEDVWRFRGQSGQSVTVEMWLHPGSGSSVEAELAVQLTSSDGTVLAEESGSVFLPPYLVKPELPADDLYHVRVRPISGAPGRYSLLLSFSQASALFTPGAPSRRQPTVTPDESPITVFSPGQFQWPTPRRAISGWTFHDPRNPGHIGLDIAAKMWDPVVAVADGVVTFAEWGGGYGNLVIVQHGKDWRSYYAHLSEIVVEVGQEVYRGELLGGAGSTGYSTGPHLHFELRYQGRPVDPHIYLP